MAGRDLANISLVLLGIFLFFHNVDANCKSRDAKWKKNKDLIISQPSRTDPSKIRVAWTGLVENERCVDEFIVYAWKKGLDRKNGTSYRVAKTVYSKDVNVDPCVEYNFQIDLQENDLFGKDMEKSKIKQFKPAAVAKIKDTDKRNFWVGYHFDKIKQVYDLSKVAIRFRKDIIQNTNCIKHIEIIGTEVPRMGRSKPGALQKSTALQQLSPTYGIPGFGYGGGRTDFPGLSSSVGGHSSYGGHSKGSSSWSSVVGGHNSYNSKGSSSGTYGSTVKGYGSYPGYPGSSHGSHGRYKRGLFSSSKKTTTPKPRRGSAREASPSGKPTGKITPPFNRDIIEVTAKITPCKAYRFTLKIVTPQSSTLGQITDLEVPLVTEMSDYRPPALSKLFRVEHKLNQGPIIKLQPGYGVPAACLKDFFEAVDLHIDNLETGLKFHQSQVNVANAAGRALRERLTEEKSEQLDLFGCKCNATRILFNTTDSSIYKKNREVFGIYKYEGLHDNKPYYKRMDSSLYPSRSRPGYSSSSRPGSSNTYSSTSNFNYTPPSNGDKIFYLYWDSKSKTWSVGEKMNGKSAEFRTKKNSVAKCPADPNTTGTWQRSGTLSWKDERQLKATCGMGIWV